MQTIGTRAQVWHGTAKKTPGGLTKINLMKNKHGRIVSKRKHASGKKTIKHLKSLGYVAKKGGSSGIFIILLFVLHIVQVTVSQKQQMLTPIAQLKNLPKKHGKDRERILNYDVVTERDARRVVHHLGLPRVHTDRAAALRIQDGRAGY
jgi:hypothetical protein